MRLINWILVFPFVLIALSFTISNRQDISLTLWPFPFTVEIPLALFALVMILIGFLFGGVASWWAGHNRRVRARETKRQASDLSREVKVLEKELDKEKAANEAAVGNSSTQVVALSEGKNAPSKWSASD